MSQHTVFPIRSCLKIDDELVSNFGPPLRKTVTFSGYTRVFPIFTPLEQSPTSTTQCAKVQPQPEKSSFKNPYSQRKGLRVSFSLFYNTIETDGRTYTSVTALEEEDDCWKPGALDGEAYYKMNCRNLVCF